MAVPTISGKARGTAGRTHLPPDATGSRGYPPPSQRAEVGIRNPHLATILQLWPTWRGTFRGFAQMLRASHRIPWGDTRIGHCLQAAGLRQRKPHTPVEAPWSHETWRTLFPGAQWLGDGTMLAVCWNGQRFVFNVEAILDPAASALLGFAVSEAEDEAALRLAFTHSVHTAGVPPLALTLDNRPSNHTPGVVAALAHTLLLRATPGRGQSKAALEGLFGLFQQAMPPLSVTGSDDREMARQTLELVLTAWARGRNGKPRKKLHGRTPSQAYAAARPTAEEIREAMHWFAELARRSEWVQQTRMARRDPVRIALLAQGLAETGIADPEARLAKDLAGYAREAIVRGLATFRSKRELGTLPVGADPGRYLGGIIRNLHTRLELEHTSQHLLAQRLRLRDLTLAPLQQEAERIREATPLPDRPQRFLDQALAAAGTSIALSPTGPIDFRFWAQATALALDALPPSQRTALYPHLCRRIAADFSTDRNRRADLIDWVAAAVAA